MFGGTAIVVHEDMLPHGDFHDGHLLSLARDTLGVLEVESNEHVLLLLERFLIHGEDSLHGRFLIGVYNFQSRGAMGSDVMDLPLFPVVHAWEVDGGIVVEQARKRRRVDGC
jgi:hypothetical protein